jgi:hypothetical protein
VSPLRYLSRFEKADGSTSITFPTYRYEWESTQPLLQSSVQLVGANYSFDQMGGAAPLKANGIERVRFLDVGQPANVDDDFDDLKAMMLWGRGKVWTTGASGNRWAWARLTEMPTISFTVENVAHFPILLLFERFSDWYDEDPVGYEGEFAIASDPQTISVVNPGNAPVLNAIITVKGPFSGLVITNDDTGYVLESSSVGAGSSDWIRFDAGRNTVEISDDSGATWTDDSANFVRTDGQVALMVIDPGSNSFTIEGANGADVVFEFSGAWH